MFAQIWVFLLFSFRVRSLTDGQMDGRADRRTYRREQ